MRISDWSSDVCSSDLQLFQLGARAGLHPGGDFLAAQFEKEVGAPVGCAGSKPGAHSVHPGWFAVQRSDWLSIQALQLPFARSRDRKSVVEGKSVSVRVDLGGRRLIKKKKNTKIAYKQ